MAPEEEIYRSHATAEGIKTDPVDFCNAIKFEVAISFESLVSLQVAFFRDAFWRQEEHQFESQSWPSRGAAAKNISQEINNWNMCMSALHTSSDNRNAKKCSLKRLTSRFVRWRGE